MTKKKKPVLFDPKKDLFNKAKVVKGDSIFKVLQKSDYKGCPVYIRMIQGNIFEYMLVYKNEIYTGFNVINPKKGKKKLNKDEVAQCGALIFTGAITTIDTLMEQDALLAKADTEKVH